MKAERFEDLYDLAKIKSFDINIYNLFKYNKDFSFKKQIERASVSIMNNIAEGFERRSNKDFKQFLFFANGSAGEVRSLLYLVSELKYINEDDFRLLHEISLDISKMTAGLIRTL